MDLVVKKPITVKITAETQLRKLSPPIAQGIAMRLKGASADAPAGAAGPAAECPPKPTDAARVARLVVKEAKVAVQEAQDDQVERREAGEAATWDKCSAECPQRRSPICKRAMR